jgi:hypothetical protein
MADNYVQFSEIIAELTQAEFAWLTKVLTIEVDELSPEEIEELAKETGLHSSDLEWGYPPFAYQFQDNSTNLWIYSEEHVNIDNMGALLHTFMEKFKREGFIKITWSETCSRPRVGEFGGGALVITAKKWDFMHTSTMAENLARELAEE